jgi:hypothetical protein
MIENREWVYLPWNGTPDGDQYYAWVDEQIRIEDLDQSRAR